MGWHIGEGGGILVRGVVYWWGGWYIVYVMSIVKVKHTIKMLMR